MVIAQDPMTKNLVDIWTRLVLNGHWKIDKIIAMQLLAKNFSKLKKDGLLPVIPIGTWIIGHRSTYCIDFGLIDFLQGYKNNSYVLQPVESNCKKYASVETVLSIKIKCNMFILVWAGGTVFFTGYTKYALGGLYQGLNFNFFYGGSLPTNILKWRGVETLWRDLKKKKKLSLFYSM